MKIKNTELENYLLHLKNKLNIQLSQLHTIQKLCICNLEKLMNKHTHAHIHTR